MSSVPTIANVINKRFCIGCGACSAIDPSFVVRPTRNGESRVEVVPRNKALLEEASLVCPMGSAPDEDTLAERFLPDAHHYFDGVGRYVDLYAGLSVEQRSDGGSGGMTRWMVAKLLRTGEIDYVVQVDRKLAGDDGTELFSYAIHEAAEEYLGHTSTSAYFPVTLDGLLKEIEARPGRCLVTALPCFARGLRSLMIRRPLIGEKVRFISGLVCGSLKSRRYAEYLGQQMAVPVGKLERINFRGKSLSRRASEKCVEVWNDASAKPVAARRVQDLDGTRYDLGYFKPKGCDYCDDVLAETADIAFGDAWIEPYSSDPNGTNVVVVRNAVLARLLREGADNGEVYLEGLTPEQVAQSQGGGLRHRRIGLSIRLAWSRLFHRWTPQKRVAPAWQSLRLNLQQIERVAIRRVTSSDHLSIQNRAFPVLPKIVRKAHRVASAIVSRFGAR